jgi:hypothetical protein
MDISSSIYGNTAYNLYRTLLPHPRFYCNPFRSNLFFWNPFYWNPCEERTGSKGAESKGLCDSCSSRQF